jgi:hypothetical protein
MLTRDLFWQAGDQGWDPLGISNLIDVRWLREAELKHGRVCMLGATGMLVQDVYTFPGVKETFGDAKMTALHDAAVAQGAMQQILVWCGFIELFGLAAIVQMLQGSDRQPGDFGFDPLNLAKDTTKLARRQLVELKNGRLAMLGLSGMVHGACPPIHAIHALSPLSVVACAELSLDESRGNVCWHHLFTLAATWCDLGWPAQVTS